MENNLNPEDGNIEDDINKMTTERKFDFLTKLKK